MHHTSGGCKVITSTKSSFTYKLSSHHQHHHHNIIITTSSSSFLSSSSSRLVDVSKTVLPRGCFMKNHHLLYWSAFSCTSITQKYKDTKEQRYRNTSWVYYTQQRSTLDHKEDFLKKKKHFVDLLVTHMVRTLLM